jgi:hypothetical protein
MATMMAKLERGEQICEVCGEPVKSVYDLCGCEKCGRMYGPWCNSVEDSICVECK